ncbi:MAG TPA: nucleoside triphosphate pyrophosphohydrolase [Nitrospiraceae bacterium]|jgi:tetrapyrrole methylase family protein/MazG family protein|nr:nucleoside triphosphate pyrophosphohydrolase [Nitrospiraceae bacterium]
MSYSFSKLVELMAALRAPDGCPWDRKQTHESLKPYLLEEAYEVLETIDRQDTVKLKEELGDLLLQVLFHAQIAAEAGAFTIEEVMRTLADKLVRRHPHVFAQNHQGESAVDVDQVLSRWEDIKRAEREQSGEARSVLDGVPITLPALLRAYQVQARTSRLGFDWPHTARGIEQVLDKIEEEIRELRAELASPPSGDASSSPEGAGSAPSEAVAMEFGDILFALVNLARLLNVNPEDALRRATNRFSERFRHIEAEAIRRGRPLGDLSLAEMDALWEEAKHHEAKAAVRPDAES